MEAVDLSLPSTEITESDKKYQNPFWRWYENLALFFDKELIPDIYEAISQGNDFNEPQLFYFSRLV